MKQGRVEVRNDKVCCKQLCWLSAPLVVRKARELPVGYKLNLLQQRHASEHYVYSYYHSNY